MRPHTAPQPELSPTVTDRVRPRPSRRRLWLVLLLFAGWYMWSLRPVPAAFTWLTDYEAARQQSADSGKPILLEFQTASCGYCRQMDRETFSQPEVARALSGWLPVRPTGDDWKELSLDHRVTGYPTFVALAPDGEVLSRAVGYMSKNDFLAFIAKAASLQSR